MGYGHLHSRLDRKPRDKDHFLVFPSAIFIVDYVAREVLDGAISQVDEETLKTVDLEFFKNKVHNGRRALHPSVVEKLKKAREEFRKKSKGGLTTPGPDVQEPEANCYCAVVCGGYADTNCWAECFVKCCHACEGAVPIAGIGGLIVCCSWCAAACSAICYVPPYCCLYQCSGGGGCGCVIEDM